MRKIKLVKYSLFSVFFLIALILAYYSDWKYDEAWTYNGINDNSLFDLLTYTKFKYANNHLINSLYFMFLQNKGISNVFFFRILSLIGFVLFFYSNSQILGLLKINQLLLISLIIAPYFIYFTIGRGYGLALGFFSASFLFLINFDNNPTLKNGYLFIIFGILSFLSIFSFLFGFLSMLLIYIFLKRHDLFSIHSFVQFTLTFLMVIYVYFIAKIVNDFDPYIIGSSSLLKNGTISSILTDFSFYSILKPFSFYYLFKILILVCLIFPMFFLVKMRKKDIYSDLGKVFFYIVLIFIFSSILMVIANILFGAKYPYGRAVMYLHYILLLVLVLITSNFSKNFYYIPITILFIVSFGFVVKNLNDLFRPSMYEVLSYTENAPVFITGHNPNVKLINSLYNIKDASNLRQSNNINDINHWIDQEHEQVVYILTAAELIDSIQFKLERIETSRSGFILLKLKK